MPEIGDTPILIKPDIDWSKVDRDDIKLTAKQLKTQNPDLSEDTITSWLLYMKEHNVSLTQERYDKLLAGDPVLTQQEISDIAAKDIKNVMESNPWLAPNATTMFTIAFLELAYKLSEMKMGEAQVAIGAMGQMMEMANIIADLIMEIAKKERLMHIASAVAAGVSAAGSGIGAGLGVLGNADRSMAYSQLGKSVGELGTMGSEIAKSFIVIDKGAKESIKQIVETSMRLQEKMLDQALGAYKSKDDEVAQVLQKLMQIISEAYKAHSLQAH